MYEVIEAATRYEFDSRLLEDLIVYLKENPKLLIAHWYRTLDELNMKKVKISSAYSQRNP